MPPIKSYLTPASPTSINRFGPTVEGNPFLSVFDADFLVTIARQKALISFVTPKSSFKKKVLFVMSHLYECSNAF